jgi:fibronectin type III domain protein/HYR domain-containing protein
MICRLSGTFGLALLILGVGRFAGADSLTLAWNPNTEPDIAGYVVYWGTQPASLVSSLDVGNQTSTQITGLASATTYYIDVRAYNTAGLYSGPSVVISGVPIGSPAPPISMVCRTGSGTSLDGKPVAVNYPAPSVTGGTMPITTSCSPSSGSAFAIGTTSISCTATDSLKQTASCTTAVVVSRAPESQALSLSCPVVPPTVSPDGEPAVVSFASPAVTGGVRPIVTSCLPASGSRFAVGTTRLSCSATDAQKQSASCSTNVTVALAPPPAIVCPLIATARSSNGRPISVSYAPPSVEGGVAPVATSCTPRSNSLFPVGSTTVGCTAVDALARSQSCSTLVTVTRWRKNYETSDSSTRR